MKRLRYIFDECDRFGCCINNNNQHHHLMQRYHGTSILCDAITILYTKSTTTVSITTTTTTTDDDDNRESIPSYLHTERDAIYVTACTLFHRYYNCMLFHHNNNHRRSTNNDNDNDDVWSVSMACLLLAYKLHDILSTNQICIYDIIYTFCAVIYRQRILLPKFIPAIPLSTTTTTTGTTTSTTPTTTTIDVIAKQKEYYTKNVVPFVPHKWQQLSNVEQHQLLFHQKPRSTKHDTPVGTGPTNDSPSNTIQNTAATFLSKSGPLYTEWFQAVIQMECQILYTLQYRIYDIPHQPSIYQYIPILIQRYIQQQQPQPPPSATTNTTTGNMKNNKNGISTKHDDPTHKKFLSTITTRAYEYCRIAVQIISNIDAAASEDDDDHPCPNDIQFDSNDTATTIMTTTSSTITFPQIIACACLYCSVMTLDRKEDMVPNTTNPHHRNNALTHNDTHIASTMDNSQGTRNSINHSFDDRWKRLLFPPTSLDDRRTTSNNDDDDDDEKQWASIQHDMNTFLRMLYRTTNDPNYYIAQSNYCNLGLETTRHPATTTTTTTKSCFHDPDSYTWHRCITNII